MSKDRTRKRMVLVGVYGSLRKGFGNSHCLFDSEYVDKVKTTDKFLMYDVGFYPVVFKPAEEGVGSQLTLELYEVDGDTLAKLDLLEGVPDFYDRYEITNIKGYEGETIFMYITNPDLYERVAKVAPLVKSGDWEKGRPDLKKLYNIREERIKRMAKEI